MFLCSVLNHSALDKNHKQREVAMSIIYWCWRAFWDILKLLVVWSTGAQTSRTAGKVHRQKQKKWLAKFFESHLFFFGIWFWKPVGFVIEDCLCNPGAHNLSGQFRLHTTSAPKRWLRKGNPLTSGKSKFVKYFNLARFMIGFLAFFFPSPNLEPAKFSKFTSETIHQGN